MARLYWLAMAREIEERSFGVIPLVTRDGEIFVFLIQNHEGAWLFPKGHAEHNEHPLETSSRELFEETGLSIEKWVSDEPYIERYYVSRDGEVKYKEVQYFIAWVSGSICLQEEEIADGYWCRLSEAHTRVTFLQTKELVSLIQQRCQAL